MTELSPAALTGTLTVFAVSVILALAWCLLGSPRMFYWMMRARIRRAIHDIVNGYLFLRVTPPECRKQPTIKKKLHYYKEVKAFHRCVNKAPYNGPKDPEFPWKDTMIEFLHHHTGKMFVVDRENRRLVEANKEDGGETWNYDFLFLWLKECFYYEYIVDPTGFLLDKAL